MSCARTLHTLYNSTGNLLGWYYFYCILEDTLTKKWIILGHPSSKRSGQDSDWLLADLKGLHWFARWSCLWVGTSLSYWNDCPATQPVPSLTQKTPVPFTVLGVPLNHQWLGLSRWVSDKEAPCNAGDPGSIPGLGRSPGEGNGNPLQYSCPENTIDRAAWRATDYGVAEEADATE